MQRPTEPFVCSICAEEGDSSLHEPDDYAGFDVDTNKPICHSCAELCEWVTNEEDEP